MRSTAFLKKELKEIIKTPKLLILPSIFLFFGFLSPLLAKNMPQLLKSLVSDVQITIQEPTYIDSYAQFFKNMGQIGIIVVILSFMSIVVEEKVKGSASLVLTKGVSRLQFIVSKLSAAIIFFTAAYIISSAACIYYTYLLFPVYYNNSLPIAFLLFWLYGVFVVCATVFASILARSQTMAAVLAFLIFAAVSAISAIPEIGVYSPSYLASLNMQVMSGVKSAGDATVSVVSAIIAAIALSFMSVWVFRMQEI